MIKKFAEQYILYAAKESNKNELIRNGDLGSKSSTLGEFVNKADNTILRVYATKLFEGEYNSIGKADIKPAIDKAINKIKKTPIPPETEDWRTLERFKNKLSYTYKVATYKLKDTDYHLVYLYVQFKPKNNDIEYTHVILTDCGNPEVFNVDRAEFKLLQFKMETADATTQDRKFSDFCKTKSEILQKNYSTNEFINLNGNNMNLELNLVKTQSIHTRICSLIARKREQVKSASEAMDAILAFIQNNTLTFNAAITNKALLDQLSNLKTLSVDDLYSLKYIMSSSGGIDLIPVVVSENEDNEFEIPKDIIEYNIIDNLRAPLEFVKFATKIPLNNKGNLTELYTKIIEMYGLFENDLFSGITNPLTSQLNILRNSEIAIGVTPSALTQYLNGVIEYLGKDIYAIMP